MEIVLLAVLAVLVAWWLGLFKSVTNLAAIAEREAAVLNAEHKLVTAERYLDLGTVDVAAVNAAVKKINELDFD